jgi:hypothetical protein
MKPEQQARQQIDRQLEQCGWDVQDYRHMNISAIRNHYDLNDLPDKETAIAIAAPWQPYASVASWYCWRSLDLKWKTDGVTTGYRNGRNAEPCNAVPLNRHKKR